MNTIINCGSAGCATLAQDTISVKIKDGDNEDFNEVLNINGRSIDDRWYNQYILYEAKNDKIRVR